MNTPTKPGYYWLREWFGSRYVDIVVKVAPEDDILYVYYPGLESEERDEVDDMPDNVIWLREAEPPKF